MRAQILAALILCAFARPALAADGGEHAGWPAARASRQKEEIASCYGREHRQTRTATGAAYDPSRLTAAHRSLPFGTRVRVCNLSWRASGVGGAAARAPRCATVIINDRGPAAWTHRAIDLSLAACRAIGNSGLARVFLQIVGGPHEAHSHLRSRRHVHQRRRG